MIWARSVSVVIPVFNASATIRATLESLQHQTSAAWEAVVVDDGSGDDTAAVVVEIARNDSRIRLIGQTNQGVSTARNTGTEHAEFDWLLFLDGDDLLSPYFLERAMDALEAKPSSGGAHTTWVRLLPDGRLIDENPAFSRSEFFDFAARECPFAIHSCVVRRQLVQEVGGFDPTLRLGEDWDLWVRIARMGVTFVPVPEAVAIYRSRVDSVSFDGPGLQRDGIRVLERAHAPDPRVKRPAAAHAHGRDARLLDQTILMHTTWCAGLMVGQQLDPLPLLEEVGDAVSPTLSPIALAYGLSHADRLGSGGEPLWHRWGRDEKTLTRYLERLEQRSGSPQLAERTLLALARIAADESRSDIPIRLGRMHVQTVELDRPISDIVVPKGIERARLRAEFQGATVGQVELSAVDGRISGRRVVDAVVQDLGWETIETYLHVSSPNRRNPWVQLKWSNRRRGQRQWSLFLDEVFGTVRASGSRRVTEGQMDIELSEPMVDLVVDGVIALDINLGGVPVGRLRVHGRRGRIPARSIEATIVRYLPTDLQRAAARAGVVGRLFDDREPLRSRFVAAALDPPEVRDDASDVLLDLRVPLTSRWWLTYNRLAPRSKIRLRAVARRLAPQQKALLKTFALRLRFVPGLLRSFGPAGPRFAIPVLMYHRVSPGGSKATEQWRVHPDRFRRHLAALSAAGYQGITLDQLRRGLYEGERLPRRPVVISFDDGYQDFADNAWPALRRRGFGSTVFVVSSQVGRTNVWDDVFNDPAALMDWDTLRRLSDEGVEIGSHTVDHRALTASVARRGPPRGPLLAPVPSRRRSVSPSTRSPIHMATSIPLSPTSWRSRATTWPSPVRTGPYASACRPCCCPASRSRARPPPPTCSGSCGGSAPEGQAAERSRMCTPHAEPSPMTWARPTVAPSI